MKFKLLSLRYKKFKYFNSFSLLLDDTLSSLKDKQIPVNHKQYAVLQLLNLFKVNAPFTIHEAFAFNYQVSPFHLYLNSTYNRQTFTTWQNILMSHFCRELVDNNSEISPSYLFLNTSKIKTILCKHINYYSINPDDYAKKDLFINKIKEQLGKNNSFIFIHLEGFSYPDQYAFSLYEALKIQHKDIKNQLMIGYLDTIHGLNCLTLPYYIEYRTTDCHGKLKSLFNRCGATVDPSCFLEIISSTLSEPRKFSNWLNSLLLKLENRLIKKFDTFTTPQQHYVTEIIDEINLLNGSIKSHELFLTNKPSSISDTFLQTYEQIKQSINTHSYQRIIHNYIEEIMDKTGFLNFPERPTKNLINLYNRLELVFKKLIDNHDSEKQLPLFMHAFQEFQECFLEFIRLNPEKKFQTYEEFVTQKLNNLTSITPMVIPQTFGMATFFKVVNSLDSQIKRYPTVQVVGNSYFEVLCHFQESQEAAAGIFNVSSFSRLNYESDVVITDIHPNNATQFEINPNAIAEYLDIRMQLPTPLTLILDITLNHVDDDEIIKLITRFKEQIDEGKLNLVLVKSNTKLDQLGSDTVNMGSCIILNNPNMWGQFNTSIRSNSSIVDTITQKFFGLSASTEAIKVYRKKIVSNKNLFVSTLERYEKPSDQIKLSQYDTDEDSVYVSLHCKSGKFAKDVINCLIKLSNKMNQSLTTRMSIGFNMSSINDCLHTIRFCFGLESVEQIKMFAKFIAYFNNNCETLGLTPKQAIIKAVENATLESIKAITDTHEFKIQKKTYNFLDTEATFSYDPNTGSISTSYRFDTRRESSPDYIRYTDGTLNEDAIIIQGDHFSDKALSSLNPHEKKVWFNSLEFRTFIRVLAPKSVTEIGQILCQRHNLIKIGDTFDIYETNPEKTGALSISIKPHQMKLHEAEELLKEIESKLAKQFKISTDSNVPFRKITFKGNVSIEEIIKCLDE